MESVMSESSFPQVQQAWSFFEKVAKDNVSMFETAVDTQAAVAKASLNYATLVTEQWGKLVAETTRRFSKPAS
jgi:hypothetical protein